MLLFGSLAYFVFKFQNKKLVPLLPAIKEKNVATFLLLFPFLSPVASPRELERANKWGPSGVGRVELPDLSVFGGPVEAPRIDEKESFL